MNPSIPLSNQHLLSPRIREKLRLEIFDLLGHQCVLCGFKDKRALQIDHVNGGGIKDYKIFKAPMTMYRYYINHPTEAKKNLQILCANCNWIKRYTNNEV